MCIGNVLESLSQGILVRTILVGRLGVIRIMYDHNHEEIQRKAIPH